MEKDESTTMKGEKERIGKGACVPPCCGFVPAAAIARFAGERDGN